MPDKPSSPAQRLQLAREDLKTILKNSTSIRDPSGDEQSNRAVVQKTDASGDDTNRHDDAWDPIEEMDGSPDLASSSDDETEDIEQEDEDDPVEPTDAESDPAEVSDSEADTAELTDSEDDMEELMGSTHKPTESGFSLISNYKELLATILRTSTQPERMRRRLKKAYARDVESRVPELLEFPFGALVPIDQRPPRARKIEKVQSGRRNKTEQVNEAARIKAHIALPRGEALLMKRGYFIGYPGCSKRELIDEVAQQTGYQLPLTTLTKAEQTARNTVLGPEESFRYELRIALGRGFKREGSIHHHGQGPNSSS